MPDKQSLDFCQEKKANKYFLAIYVETPIKPLGKLFRNPKTDCKNLSELQELEVRAKGAGYFHSAGQSK